MIFDLTSSIIGAGVIILFWIIGWLIKKWNLKKYSIEDVKTLIKNAHTAQSKAIDDIKVSHDNLAKLYRAMLDIEKYNE